MLYRFDECELDDRLYQLRRKGERVEIEPKAFDLLVYLLHQREHVVTKDELRAAMTIRNCGGQLSYWRTPSGTEVDFIWSRAKTAIGIEAKLSPIWRREFGSALKELYEAKKIQKCYAVYLGATRLKDGPIEVLPLKDMMQALVNGLILP